MGETLVTVVGNVASQPELKVTANGAAVTRFRIATTERRFDRAGDRWTDGHTNFFTVWAWRALGENVSGSLGIGDPVIVQGKLRVQERQENGQGYVSAGIDAMAVGHDLNRGTSAFRRAVRSRPDWGDRSPEPTGTPVPPAVADPFALPAPDPDAAGAETAPFGAPEGEGAAEPVQPELVPS